MLSVHEALGLPYSSPQGGSSDVNLTLVREPLSRTGYSQYRSYMMALVMGGYGAARRAGRREKVSEDGNSVNLPSLGRFLEAGPW